MPTSVLAECAPRPVNACELVNSDKEIFVGRVLSSADDTGATRVRVLRTYKGTAAGDILVTVFSKDEYFSFARLTVGYPYLFYASKIDEVRRETGQGCNSDWWPLSAVSRDELAFLARLNRRSFDGRIFGTVERQLNFRDSQPLAGIRVLVNNGRRTSADTTDQKGHFDIHHLQPGTYRISASVPDTLLVEEVEEIEIFPHGCFEADLIVLDATTISGRITLPPGVKVSGTRVSALSTTGAEVKTAFADAAGRYTIRGLAPGEYVVGINADQSLGAAAPYPATYAPDARDVERAMKVRITGPANVADVDISVPVALEIVTVNVKATFEDGRPVQDQPISVSTTGYGTHDMRRTNMEGMVSSLPVLRGIRTYLFGAADSRCLAPAAIGPHTYPDLVQVTYTADGCREQSNLVNRGMLYASFRGTFSELHATVTFPDGSPAYDASVAILSKRDLTPFAQLFRTDKNGGIDLPLPNNQEFEVRASIHRTGTSCESQILLFNTEKGIRWRLLVDRSGRPSWEDVEPSSGAIQLVLDGPSCKPTG